MEVTRKKTPKSPKGRRVDADFCRTYGARPLLLTISQGLRPGLHYGAPPALSARLAVKPEDKAISAGDVGGRTRFCGPERELRGRRRKRIAGAR